MTKQRLVVVLFCLASVVTANSSNSESNSDSDHHHQCLLAPSSSSSTCSSSRTGSTRDVEQQQDVDVCDVYMAPSTIPGAGVGIFTGRPLQPGDPVTGGKNDADDGDGGGGGGDVLIPVVDVKYHLLNSNSQKLYTQEFTSDYVWAGYEMGMAQESAWLDDGGVTAFCPGLDAAINCHLALINVDKTYPQYDNMNFHRSRDPGAGAFSPYHNLSSVATAYIPAGGELFKYYGEHWFLTRQNIFPNLPLSENYDLAQDLLHTFDELVQNVSSLAKNESFQRELYNLFKHQLHHIWGHRSRTINALPNNFDLLPLARVPPQTTTTTTPTNNNNDTTTNITTTNPQEQGNSTNNNNNTSTTNNNNNNTASSSSSSSGRITGVRATHQPASVRSLSVLHQQGRCISNVLAKRSTVAQAGRGLFAKKHFRTGDIVTGTPLLFGDSVEFMTLYEGDWWNRKSPPSPERIEYNKQLVLNYCYTHDDAIVPMYLCPYGHLVNYINHYRDPTNSSSTTSTHRNTTTQNADTVGVGVGPNVRPVWAPHGFLGQDNANFDLHPSQILRASPGLFWDYVATRDIAPGEELFLDYGPAWEEAWNEHVQNFETTHKHFADPNYLSAREYNVKYANSILLTEEEERLQQLLQQKKNANHNNKDKRTVVSSSLHINNNDNNNNDYHSYPDNLEMRCLNELASKPDMTAEEANALWTIDNTGSTCRILRRDVVVAPTNHPNEGTTQDQGAASGSSQQLETFVYTIDLEYKEWVEDMNDYYREWYHSMPNVPREAIRFVDVPYTTDLFLPFAFRHPIAIPDDMFPAAWRRNNSSSSAAPTNQQTPQASSTSGSSTNSITNRQATATTTSTSTTMPEHLAS